MRPTLLIFYFISLVLTSCQTASDSDTRPPPTVQAATATALPRITAIPQSAVPVNPLPANGTLPRGSNELPWWNNTVFYEIFVRSFYDSDGDGIGDLEGLISQLDYLNDGNPETTSDLGITGIWLMPVTQSPSYHGYDVTDYRQIDDEYGDNETFKQLVVEAHSRGIYIIVDLVLNHTSSEHPWFISAAAAPDAPKRDWYVWANESAAGRGWHPHPNGGRYYGLFWSEMPDLNYANPEVTTEMVAVTRFWLEEMGVDGFRLDAVKHLVEDGLLIEHTPATHEWLTAYHQLYKEINPEALTVGEIWSTSDDVADYVTDEVDIAFEFHLAENMLQSAMTGQKVHIERAQQLVYDSYPEGQFATFLANHDQNRTRSRLFNDEQAKVAATLQLTFPGVPFIYYGEEIGMLGEKPDEHIRRPLQWDQSGGFTTGEPWRSYGADFNERHIAGQLAEPTSLLTHYQQLIRLRQTYESLRNGRWRPLTTDHKKVTAYLRYTDQEWVLILINLSNQPVDNYTILLENGPLPDNVYPAVIYSSAPTDPSLLQPFTTPDGGLALYQPTTALAPYESLLIQLQPAP